MFFKGNKLRLGNRKTNIDFIKRPPRTAGWISHPARPEAARLEIGRDKITVKSMCALVVKREEGAKQRERRGRRRKLNCGIGTY